MDRADEAALLRGQEALDGMTARFKFLKVGDLRGQSQVWRVLRVIPGRGFIVLWGPPGSGKTFAAIDLVASVCQGIPWAGRRTKRGNVVYIAAEGQLGNRLSAYLEHHGLEDLPNLRVLPSAVNLLDPGADLQPLLASLSVLALETGGIAMVVVDTLNRVMPGGDENSSQDMGSVIAAAKAIEDEFACAVLFVHHCGKDETRGSRGHSSLKGATDAEISVKRDGDIRTITAEKVRDGEDGEVLMTFRLQSVDLGPMIDFDPDAEPDERCTSCVVVPTDAVPSTLGARLSDSDQIALRAIQDLCADTPDRTAASSLHPAGLPMVSVIDWRERFRRLRGVDKNDAKEMGNSKKAFQRGVDKLVKLCRVGVYGDKAWLY